MLVGRAMLQDQGLRSKDDEDGEMYISLHNMEIISHFHAEILVEW